MAHRLRTTHCCAGASDSVRRVPQCIASAGTALSLQTAEIISQHAQPRQTTPEQPYYTQENVVADRSPSQDDMDCPLCLEEMDISDLNFKPCPCGYQVSLTYPRPIL